MNNKRTTLIIVISTLAVGFIIYYAFNPESENFFPPCPFHYLTGLACPGCGSQRAIHSLLHLQIKDAFIYNPLFLCAIPYLLIGIYFEYLGGNRRFPRVRKILFGRSAILLIFCLIIFYWITRNILHF